MSLENYGITELMAEIEVVIKAGVQKIVKKQLKRNRLLEKTHRKIMKLPSVLKELKALKLKTDVIKKSNDKECMQLILKRLDAIEKNNLNRVSVVEAVDKKENKIIEIKKIHIKKEVEPEKEPIQLNIIEQEIEEEAEEEAEEDVEEDVEEDAEAEDVEDVEAEEAEDAEAEEAEDAEEEEAAAEEADAEADAEEEAEEDADVEAEAEEKAAEEEEEYFEIEIDDITYFTNDEVNGFIYDTTEDGYLGDKVGVLKDGEPNFY